MIPNNVKTINFAIQENQISLALLLKSVGLVVSTSEAYRLIKQGGIRIDEHKVEDFTIKISKNTEHIYQVCKYKFMKVKLL